MTKSIPIDAIVSTLEKDKRAIFAYLYGSAARGETGRDIDIAVYAEDPVDPYRLSADLKTSLHQCTGLPADDFDVRILNSILQHGDIFDLLYLKQVLTESTILVDKRPDVRADFLERYGSKYRECEGLMAEVLA